MTGKSACASLFLAGALAALLTVLNPKPVAAQGSPAPVTLIRAGNLFDSEAGRMVGSRDVLIRGDRVAEVGQGLAPPQGAAARQA